MYPNNFRPSVKHVLGVLEWFYMLSAKILFQNRGLVFYFHPNHSLPPVWQKTRLFTDFFLRNPPLIIDRSISCFIKGTKRWQVGQGKVSGSLAWENSCRWRLEWEQKLCCKICQIQNSMRIGNWEAGWLAGSFCMQFFSCFGTPMGHWGQATLRTATLRTRH